MKSVIISLFTNTCLKAEQWFDSNNLSQNYPGSKLNYGGQQTRDNTWSQGGLQVVQQGVQQPSDTWKGADNGGGGMSEYLSPPPPPRIKSQE